MVIEALGWFVLIAILIGIYRNHRADRAHDVKEETRREKRLAELSGRRPK